MENLISGEEKFLKFPYREFHKYFKNYPAGIIKEVIVDNSIACYCYYLTLSLLFKKVLPSFEKPKASFVYYLSEFEINHLRLLNNVNKFKLLKLNIKEMRFENDFFKAFLNFRVTPFINEDLKGSKLIIEIDLNFKSIKVPLYKQDALKFFKLLYSFLLSGLSFEKKQKECIIKPQFFVENKLDKFYFPVLNLPYPPFYTDTLVCVFSLWMNNRDKDFMLFSVDDILSMRKTKKLFIKGKRTGYKNSLRDKVKNDILKLNQMIKFEDFLWADDKDDKKCSNLFWAGDVTLFEINTWCFSDNYYFVARPSEYLNYLIAKKSYLQINPIILGYHSKIMALEKKLAYFLIVKLKKKNSVEIKIRDLIEFLYNKTYFDRPSKVRDRVEEALDKLSDDNIIKWQYEKINESIFAKRSWILKWLNLNLIIQKT